MKLDKYPVTVSEGSIVYEFISEGKKGKIAKMIVYSKTNIYNTFNLGFGDKCTNTGEINDTIASNNGDTEKVLTTVAFTLYDFTEKFPGAMVLVSGSTSARTRLYQMAIGKNLCLIEPDFEVFGYAENEWQLFERQYNYEAFLVKRKKY